MSDARGRPAPSFRDPRRLFTPAQRAEVAARQHHRCGVCQLDLPGVFHVHHVVPWDDGGRTHPDNGLAVCPDCHRKAPVGTPPAFTPRQWQTEALSNILPLLRRGEFATLSAATGAGKTEFSAWVFSNLRAVGDCVRLVVLVPTTSLRDQWVDVCANRRIFLRNDSITERHEEDGVVITYHALLDPARLQQLTNDAAQVPTLFVLDEVHHLAKRQQYVKADADRPETVAGGEAGAWAVNITRLVGTPDQPSHPTLNLSATLLRSNPSERIATIRYRRVGDQIETEADYAITAGRLISEGQLRHIKVLAFDADMTVTAVDLNESKHRGAETIRAVDLDGDGQLRSRVLPEMVRSRRFIGDIIGETIHRLGHASVALGGAPVKWVIVADDIAHAEQVHAELSGQIGPRRAFLAHGKMDSADREIERFRKSSEQAIMVAVQKVTEGFDVPDVCGVTYLRTWKAPLFIAQLAGRAMRITAQERELGMPLPATIIVPNDAEVKAAFADILVGALRVLEAPPEPCPQCGREMCTCPPRPRNKICPQCQQSWKVCICPCSQCGRSAVTGCVCWRKPSPNCERCGRPQRFCICFGPTTVDVVGDAELWNINVDGDDVEVHIVDSIRQSMTSKGLPVVFLEQAAAGAQQAMDDDPMAFITHLRKGGDSP